jgi:hypothetical protein
MMNFKIDWTQKLGNAVIDQQADVMDAIQRLRAKAQANNKLQTTEQQKVVVSQEQGIQIIAIEPTDPNTVYVPYYDPGVVYGEWPYPDYPHTTGWRPDISLPASSRPASPSAPAMLSHDGGPAVIGAATSIGTETTSR